MNNIISRPKVIPRELNQGGTSTSEVAFTSDGTIPVVLPFPSAGEVAGQGQQSTWAANASGARAIMGVVRVRAFGRVTGGTTTNFTPQLQWGTSATPGSNTDLESGGAVAVNSVSGFWYIDAVLYVDKASGKLNGTSKWGVVGSTVTHTAEAAIDNNITSVDPSGNGTLGFVVTGTFSSGNASNAAYLDGFYLELLA